MKFLENSVLDQLSSNISASSTDCVLDFKVEAYSCKMIQSDKKQWKNTANNTLFERQPLAPPEEFAVLATSPLGHSHRMRHLSEPSSSCSDNDGDDAVLVDSISTRTLFDLIGVLNTAYPDYDFSDVKSSAFSRMPDFETVVNSVDAKFIPVVSEFTELRNELWNAVETEINPKECKIYSYNSSYEGDPFSEEGVMWCFNFFFHNKNLKRLLFISCRAVNNRDLNMSAEEMWNMEEE